MKTEKILGVKAQRESAKFVDWLILQGVEREAAATAVQTFALKLAGKKPKEEPMVSTGTQTVVSAYVSGFKKKIGAAPPIDGSVYRIASELTNQYGTPAMLDMIDIFFDEPDDFVERAGYGIGVFRSQITKLLARRLRKVRSSSSAGFECHHVPRCQNAVEHSRKYLQNMGKGMTG